MVGGGEGSQKERWRRVGGYCRGSEWVGLLRTEEEECEERRGGGGGEEKEIEMGGWSRDVYGQKMGWSRSILMYQGGRGVVRVGFPLIFYWPFPCRWRRGPQPLPGTIVRSWAAKHLVN